MLCGGQGSVSVTANVAPRLMHALCKAAIAGQRDEAMRIQKLFCRCTGACLLRPIDPVKWAMQRMGPVWRRLALATDANERILSFCGRKRTAISRIDRMTGL